MLIASSLGAIIVGQLTTVVYQSASLEQLRNGREGSSTLAIFVFFLSIQLVSAVASLVLGRRIMRMRRATVAAAADAASGVEMELT
jgi:hypothetical protein